MTSGSHEVILKFSNFHARNKVRFYSILIGDSWTLNRYPIIVTAFVHIYAGFFLIIGLFFLVLYLTDVSRQNHAFFGLISISFFALIILEYIKTYYHYPYGWHFTRLLLILGITIFISLLLPLFFSIQFNSPGKMKRLGALVLIYAVLVGLTHFIGYDYPTMIIMYIGFWFSFYLCAKAYFLGKTTSLLALLGVAPIPLCTWYFFLHYDYVIFLGFGHLILMLLISLAIQWRHQRKTKEAAQLLSSRLELELLKKNIQPHFLMNSLTSAIDWIEENPQVGIDLLYALVREFDIILDISDKKKIPLQQEIALCRTHAEIMSFRKEQNYILNTEGIQNTELIPPAILHTLIENGISHCTLEKPDIHFFVSFQKQNGTKKYHLFTEGENEGIQGAYGEGTGLKYVKARLEESYPGNWSLISNPVEGGWETLIQINDNN